MLQKFEIKIKKLPSWMPTLLAGAGALLYLIQAFIYAFTTVSSLDEGSYLLKGILFMRRVYEPFEWYGPLTNKAPFAFLIPGFAEYVFGPGLRTGRFFSIFLGLLTVFGVWITARRWAGKWMATLTVWIFALSPMIIKLHARTVSEVIIACMLAWICVLALDEKRPLWQIIIASVLAAAAVLTRQNMVLLLPLFVLYIFWQHGKQKGIWSFVTVSVIFLAVHLYYWPNILVIWAPWLPDSLTPFLDPFRMPKDAIPIWDPQIDFWNRMNALFQGIRYHFIALIGGTFALLRWRLKSNWKSDSAMRAAYFLASAFFILFAMHAWAALASQYESYSCVFCFSNYLTFFDPLGILLFIIVFSSTPTVDRNRLVKILLVVFILIVSTGIGFSLFERVSDGLLNFPVPRFREGKFLPGSVTLVDMFRHGLNFSLPVIKRIISAALGLLAGIIVLFVSVLYMRRNKNSQYTPVLLNTFLIFGILLSPVLHLGESSLNCRENIIKNHEILGAYLDDIIPPDSLVYWDGGNAFTPMVYILDVRIFPAQINDGYTYRFGGDPEIVDKFTHWNSELDKKWQESADIFIIEGKRYTTWKDFLNPQEFAEYQKPPVSPSCNEGAELRIFHRLP